jgi:hypothetical protein
VLNHIKLKAEAYLQPDESNLANFLDTLQGNDRDRFLLIENFVTSVFSEFETINPTTNANDQTISLTLKVRGAATRVPLTHCGTGVEQVLALATFVLTQVPGSVILLDEPHSYLHPIAERQVIDFLSEHKEHTYLVATHSSIFVNAVEPSRIVYVEQGNGQDYFSRSSADPGTILHEMGYKNSDFAFNDRLIFVEGPSDSTILPLLLKKTAKTTKPAVDATGFPELRGVPGAGRKGGDAKATKVL